MSETQEIVALARRARERGERLCMATVVHVDGSAYRKPGARMLLTAGGERAGTISGGCLEAEVSRKAWWLTARGARVERYSSFMDEDGGMPYGLGCGGTITLLLEQGRGVDAVVDALERSLLLRQSAVVVASLGDGEDGRPAGTVAVLEAAANEEHGAVVYLRDGELGGGLADAAALARGGSCMLTGRWEPWGSKDAEAPAYFVECVAPPPALTIFGAGDDAQPIAEFAHTLGWRVSVADGRSHLARRERFPHATEVRVIDYADAALRPTCGTGLGATRREDPALDGAGLVGVQADAVLCDELAVILTHSYEQDRALLAALLPRRLQYLGILGPRHRTASLLAEVGPAIGLTFDECLERLHSPIGLDLGAEDPAAVALSIVSEIQAVLHGRCVEVTRTGVSRTAGWEPLLLQETGD